MQAEKVVQSRAQEVVYSQQSVHKPGVAMPPGAAHVQEAVAGGEAAAMMPGQRQVAEGDDLKRHEGSQFRGHDDDGSESQVIHLSDNQGVC